MSDDDLIDRERERDPDDCPAYAAVEHETVCLERLQLVEIPPELQGVPFG
jgi:hypothetical protein